MKYVDSFRRAGRSLKSAKGRTILTSLAIAVGAFTLTLALAGGTGARQYADKLIKSNVDPQSIFIAKDPSIFGEGGRQNSGLKEYRTDVTQYSGTSYKTLTAEDIKFIKNTPGVESVTPTYLVSAQYIMFEGVDRKYASDISAYDTGVLAGKAAGDLPPLGRQLGNNEIVVPESYAEILKKKPSELIGKTLTLHVQKATNVPSQEALQQAYMTGGTSAVETLVKVESRDVPFKIRAVSAKSSTSLSASTALFISTDAAKDLSEYATYGTEQYQKYIFATARAGKDIVPEDVKARLLSGYDAQGEKVTLSAKTAKDLQGVIFEIVNTIQGIVVGFGVLALIASIFGIINTQYISVLERTREIGLMKALGMRGRHVSRLFQYEAAWIGMLGGVIGALLAWGVGSAINPWLSQTLSIGENRILVFEPVPIIGLILVLMLIAMIAGWFPARKAAKLDPIEALRTE